MDGKAAGFKLEGGTAAHLPPPVAGESLNRPDESKLSSVRFLLSPSVWLRQPCADLRSACHGALVECRKSCAAIDDYETARPPKGFSLRRGSAVGGGEV